MDQKHLLGNSDARSISRHHIEKSEAVPASTIFLQHSSSRMGDREAPLDACSGIARETVPQNQGRRRESACKPLSSDLHTGVQHTCTPPTHTHVCTLSNLKIGMGIKSKIYETV